MVRHNWFDRHRSSATAKALAAGATLAWNQMEAASDFQVQRCSMPDYSMSDWQALNCGSAPPVWTTKENQNLKQKSAFVDCPQTDSITKLLREYSHLLFNPDIYHSECLPVIVDDWVGLAMSGVVKLWPPVGPAAPVPCHSVVFVSM